MLNYLYLENDGTLTGIDGTTGQRYTDVFGNDPARKAQAIGLIQQRQGLGVQLSGLLKQVGPLFMSNGSSTIDHLPLPSPPPPPP